MTTPSSPSAGSTRRRRARLSPTSSRRCGTRSSLEPGAFVHPALEAPRLPARPPPGRDRRRPRPGRRASPTSTGTSRTTTAARPRVPGRSPRAISAFLAALPVDRRRPRARRRLPHAPGAGLCPSSKSRTGSGAPDVRGHRPRGVAVTAAQLTRLRPRRGADRARRRAHRWDGLRLIVIDGRTPDLPGSHPRVVADRPGRACAHGQGPQEPRRPGFIACPTCKAKPGKDCNAVRRDRR